MAVLFSVEGVCNLIDSTMMYVDNTSSKPISFDGNVISNCEVIPSDTSKY